MKASEYEQDLAQTKGVKIKHWLQPKAWSSTDGGKVTAIELRIHRDARRPACRHRRDLRRSQADHGVQGDRPDNSCRPCSTAAAPRIALEGGRIKVDAERRTSLARCLGRRRLRRAAARTSPSSRRRRQRPRRRGAESVSISAALDLAAMQSEGMTPWQTSAPISSASNRRIRSGSPRRRRPTRSTMSSAPSRRAGAAWCGRRSARRPADRQCQRPALWRDLGRRPPPARPQQYRADHRPRAAGQSAGDQAGQARLARPRAGRLADGALRGGKLEGDPAGWSKRPAPTASSSISAARTA